MVHPGSVLREYPGHQRTRRPRHRLPNPGSTAFVNSINGAGCPGLHAMTAFVPNFPGRFEVCLSCPNWVFRVGAAGTPEQNQCVVPTGSNLGVGGPCSFNPEMYELDLSGHDYNSNDVDDAIDILDGTSLDLDMDGIPDEVESCVMPVFTGLSGIASGPARHQYHTSAPNATVHRPVDLPMVSSMARPWWTTRTWSAVAAKYPHRSCRSRRKTWANTASSPVMPAASIPRLRSTCRFTPLCRPSSPARDSGNGSFQFSFPTQPGVSYVVEFTEDLTSPDWTPLETVDGDGDARVAVDPSPDAPKRFYRVRSINPP